MREKEQLHRIIETRYQTLGGEAKPPARTARTDVNYRREVGGSFVTAGKLLVVAGESCSADHCEIQSDFLAKRVTG
jgi:hypothetical protein